MSVYVLGEQQRISADVQRWFSEVWAKISLWQAMRRFPKTRAQRTAFWFLYGTPKPWLEAFKM